MEREGRETPMTEALAALDVEVLADLAQASTATLATQLYKQGIRQPFLVELQPLEHDRAVLRGRGLHHALHPEPRGCRPDG